MKTKKLKNLVKKAKDELSWPIREVTQDSGQVRIFSDPITRIHTVCGSSDSPEEDPVRELLYLHEIGHALLCERIHPVFSTVIPIIGLDKGLMPAVTPVLNAASDWFVGHWLTDFCNELAIGELKKEYEATAEMMEKKETPTIDKFFVAVLIIAQSIKYLKKPVECSGFLDSAVQAFLAVPPEKPSVRKIEELINSLLALGAPLRCRCINSEGKDVLEFYRASEE
jgi:hypothetical protein